MVISAVLTRDAAIVPLARITDLKYTQNGLGRLLGYGTLDVESIGDFAWARG